MASCRLCGADIDWCETTDGEKVPLDRHATQPSGEDRYRFIDATGCGPVEPISPTANVQGLIDHRVTCPYGARNVGGKGTARERSLAQRPNG